METAKIFTNGASQAVRLPKEYRFDCDEVAIKKIGKVVMLYPKDKAFQIFKDGIDGFTNDVIEAIETVRKNDIPSKRDAL